MSVILEKGFISLHVGAGYHNSSKIPEYKKLCSQSCRLGARLLNEGRSCVEVVETVMILLENSGLTNAGYGSNLTLDGTVECEAAIMEAEHNTFASVACVKSLKNPIQIARVLLSEQLNPKYPELMPPMLLAGDNAVASKALQHGIATIDNQDLIAPKCKRDYEKYMRILDKVDDDNGEHSDNTNENSSAKRIKIDPDNGKQSIETPHTQDTIGVICVDRSHNVATAVSSGGIVLKQPGRVGSSAHIGCGCWAYKYSDNCTVACCTSGSGEPIIRTTLAKMASDYVASTNKEDFYLHGLNDLLENQFVNSPRIPTACYPERHCGLILVRLMEDLDEDRGHIDFCLGHTTRSFCVAYMNSGSKRVSTIVSVKDAETKNSVVSQGYSFKL